MPKKSYKDPQRAALAKQRADTMRARGFVSVDEAAEMVLQPRSNIYHWVVSGELRTEKWGERFVFVSLEDLRRKVPAAFKKAEAKPATVAPKPLRSEIRKAARAKVA